MQNVIYETPTHMVIKDDGRYQVKTIETLWSCGYYRSKAQAIKMADNLTKARQGQDLEENCLTCGYYQGGTCHVKYEQVKIQRCDDYEIAFGCLQDICIGGEK